MTRHPHRRPALPPPFPPSLLIWYLIPHHHLHQSISTPISPHPVNQSPTAHESIKPPQAPPYASTRKAITLVHRIFHIPSYHPKHAIMSADAAPSPLTKVDSAVQGLSSSPPKEGTKHRRVSSSAAGVMNINDLGTSAFPSLTSPSGNRDLRTRSL
jgi:hypothetical protein